MCRTQMDSSCEGRQACPPKPPRKVREISGENVGLRGSGQSRQGSENPGLVPAQAFNYTYVFFASGFKRNENIFMSS